MEQSDNTLSRRENEVTLKDLILRVKGWIRYLLSKWLIILLFAAIGAGLGVAYAYSKKPQYVAELNFVLEDSKSSPLSSYLGIASQMGIDLGGGSGSGIFSGDNILEFLKSRLMVEKTLLSGINVGGKEMTLADYFISINEWNKKWDKDPTLKNFHFTADRKSFTLQQDSILNVIYKALVAKNLDVDKPDKKLSFIAVKCTSRDQIFSKVFTERLVKEATDFYVQTKTKRSKSSVDYLQQKADSVEYLLNKKTYSVAASQDLNLNPARSVAGVGTELAARDKMVLQTMYAEIVKNLELSRMSMAQETPIIQIIDVPILPLEKVRFGKFKGLILGGFVAGFLTLLVLIMKRIYKEIINS